MALIGYARVSTEDQATVSQLDDLRAAGCAVIFEEKASGANRARPELARAVPGSGAATSWWSPGSTGWPARWSTCSR